MTSIISFNNYTEEKRDMCEEEIEEELIALVKAMPYNKLITDNKDSKWTYKYGKNFTFVAERKGLGGFAYFEYTLNGVALATFFGYVISNILLDKATQKSKEDYYKTLEKLVEEIQK